MKKTTHSFKPQYLILFLIMPFIGISQSGSTATYTITFESDWNGADHGTLPGNAHWSNLVGATHNSNHTFWETGGLATLGVERVAEIGSNTAFENEVNAQITANNADQYLDMMFEAPNNAASGASLVSIEVSDDYPLLSVLSMIAPSPDWFIGISNFSLLDTNGIWKDEAGGIMIDMYPYDAGTENGNGYSTSNSASNPHVAIFDRRSMIPFTGPRIGRLIITLESVSLSTTDQSFNSSISVSPNPATDVVTIKNSSNSNINSITLYNVLGNLVLKTDLNSNQRQVTIPISNLNSGIYLAKIDGDSGKSITKKLVIQ